MSDPRTPYLDLYKPIVNDEAGEDMWGEKLNSNFDKLDFWAMNQGSIPDVPVDGVLYGRKDRQWSPAASQQEVDDLSDAVDLNVADINTIEAEQLTQNTEISTKAPLGPSDGAIYGWKDTSWFQVSGSGGFTISWDNVTGKPPTYPPTLPIPESGVTGLPQKQADQDAAIAAINWNSLSGKPATFPPTLPIPSSGVTGLDTKQASQDTAILGREPAIAAGNPAYVWHGDKTWKPESPFPEAPADGQLYSRKGSTAAWVVASAGAVVSDTAPVGMPVSTIWWNSLNGGLFIDYQDPNSRQWVMVNAPGMPEANKDGKPYARKDGGWFDLTATLAAKADDTDLANYLPLTGGTLTGPLYATIGQFVAAAASGYSLFTSNSNTTGGGMYGQSGTIYGICGYTGAYSFYGNGQIYVSGQITTGAGVTLNGALGFTSVPNMALGYANDTTWTIQSGNHFQFAYSGTVRHRLETGIWRCLVDSVCSLGASSYRFTTVYASTGTINTSDENEKQDIQPLTEAELRVARALKPLICTYRWKNAVAEKSDDGARIHVGIIAQRVQEAFAAEGLDAHRYGLFCADPIMLWHDAVHEEDPETREVRTVTEGWEEDTGEIRYGVRYDELAMFILAGM